GDGVAEMGLGPEPRAHRRDPRGLVGRHRLLDAALHGRNAEHPLLVPRGREPGRSRLLDPLRADRVAAAAPHLVPRDPAGHDRGDEGVRDDPVAQRRWPRHLERAHRAVHLQDRLRAVQDRLRERGVDDPDGDSAGHRPDPDPLRQERPLMTRSLRWIAPTTVTWVLGVLFLFPVLWFLLSSFKPGGELFTWPLRLFPEDWTVSGYITAWERYDFQQYFLNTAIVAVVTTVLTVFVSACTGFALAKYRSRWVQAFFLCLLATTMLPTEVIMPSTF